MSFNNYAQMQGINTTFTLESLYYIPVGMYNPMYSRPYVANIQSHAIGSLIDRMRGDKAGKISPSHLTGLTNSLVQNSAVPIQTPIDNNWISTKKFIFILKVSYVEFDNIKNTAYLQGYTEYDGITPSGNIDPNLHHFVNTIIETSSVMYNTPLGVANKERLNKIYNVTTNNYDSQMYSQRPIDIFKKLNFDNIINTMEVGSPGMISDSVNSLYTIDPFNKRPVCSTISNRIPAEYLSRVFNAGMMTNRENSLNSGGLIEEQSYGAESKLIEPDVHDNRFLKLLSRMVGLGGGITSSVFSFSTLAAVDPTIEARFVLFNTSNTIVDPYVSSTPEVGDFWTGQDPVTIKAYGLIESSVSCATKYGFNKISFHASNMSDPTGQPVIVITGFNSFLNLDELDYSSLLEMFKDHFIQTVFLDETMNNTIPMHMEMYVDLLNTSKINLSYANYPSNWYTIPTFANSSFAPVVTIDHNAFSMLSSSLGTVSDTLVDNLNPTATRF